MTIDERVKQLRKLMRNNGIDCWYVNGTDPHQSEYVCPRWRSRAWISGFTGSAGTVVVTRTEALLWVDSRYYVQGAKQIEGSCYQLMKQEWEDTPSPIDWIKTNLKKGKVVGIDQETISVSDYQRMSGCLAEKGITLATMPDLLDQIWTDRPAVPDSKVVEVEKRYAGLSRAEKFSQVRNAMEEKGCTYYLVCAIDDIAWMTNLRGDDIKYNPVFLSYLLLGKERAWLFTDISRFSAELLTDVRADMDVMPYEAAAKTIRGLVKAKDVVYMNPDRTNVLMRAALGKARVVAGQDITTEMKARKNPTEMEGMRRAHVLDGIAMVNFLSRLDFSGETTYDELQLCQMLDAERLKNPDCLDESFGTIAGFGPNGAMCHYCPSEEEHSPVTRGLVVLDSGGQYRFGTTDITRTLAFGKPTVEEIHDYTVTLKGHLALAAAVFPKGTCGYQLDILAKQFMWKDGMSFFHGTGHGVGFRLNVHEGPQRINGRPITVAMEVGMVTSDEPGIYKEGRHGIRIENLIATVPAMKTEFGQFYKFETLTLCPYERRLIDTSLLSKEEIDQVNTYHRRVYETLRDKVENPDWLQEACKPL